MWDRGRDTEGTVFQSQIVIFLELMPVDLHQSQGKIFEDVQHKYIFSFPQHVSPWRRFSYIHDSAVSIFSPPLTSLSVFDVLHNPAFGHSVFWERDERKWFIHQTRPGIQIPGDLLISWLIPQLFLGAGAGLRLLRLSAEHGAQVIMSPVATLCDSKHKQASPLKMCTSHHLIQMSGQIKNCSDDGMIRGLDRAVRAVIILLREEIWILPQVCVFLFLLAFCGWMRHIRTLLKQIYTHQNFCDCFGLAISKTQRRGRWLSAAVRGAEIDIQRLVCLLSLSIGLTLTDMALQPVK